MYQCSGALLLSLPVALHRSGGVLYLEDQACNGLRLWAEHFERLIVLIPEAPGPPPPSWVPLERVGASLSRIELVIVPAVWRPDRFLRALPAALPRIRSAIASADLLGFAIGGLFGDWGSVAAWTAHRMGKPFYIWTDRVESQVVRQELAKMRWRRRLRSRIEVPVMAWNERALIRRAALGMFHGQDTFDAYAPHCRNPQLVHDIHIRRDDHITPEALTEKAAAARTGPLKLVYAGRAAGMKGTDDWLGTLERLAARGVNFTASWLGDGPELEEMRARVSQGPLAGRVTLPGFIAERAALLSALRAAQALVFCHQTPESPRILIEALASGCPVLGYRSAFPADLIAGHGGGLLVAQGDMAGLAEALAGLDGDRARLADLMSRAARDGAAHDDETVFAHRAALICQHLPRARPVPA